MTAKLSFPDDRLTALRFWAIIAGKGDGTVEISGSFTLASADEEAGFVLSYPAKLEMQCYSDSAYPFKIFPQKKLRTLRFEQITLLYGGNGPGKSHSC